MPKGPWKEVVYTDFSGGLNTKIEDNKIKDNESPDLLNVTFDGAGCFQPRYGSKLFGVSASLTGKISETWTTVNQLGKEVPLRMVDPTSANAYLEYYNAQTAAWETLDTGYTRGYEFGKAFYDWNTYYGSQKDYQRYWNGVSYQTSTYADSAYAVVRLSGNAVSALNFLSAGPIIIDGEETYYSSISGEMLSGITFASTHAAGVAIAQQPVSTGYSWVSASDNWPHGSMMYEMDAQMFVAGCSGTIANTVYYSAIDEPTNYKVSAVPGGGGLAGYPEMAGNITGLNSFDQIITIYKENTIRQLKFEEVADGSAGSLEIVSRNEIVSSPKIGAVNNKSITRSENDVLYVSPAGWVKALSKTNAGSQTNEISKKIRPTVEGLNMLSSSAIYFSGKYYLACATSGSSFNDTVLAYDTDYGAWTYLNGWNVSDWFIYDNQLHFGASNERATYTALTGFDDGGSAYQTYWKSKWLDFGIPEEQKRLSKIYIEGYITENTQVGVSAYFNGDVNNPISKTIDGSDTDYVINTDVTTIFGQSVWGKSIFGGTGSNASSYNLRKFRWWGQYNPNSFYNMQIKIGTASPGFVYRVTHVAPYLWKVPGEKINPNSII